MESSTGSNKSVPGLNGKKDKERKQIFSIVLPNSDDSQRMESIRSI